MGARDQFNDMNVSRRPAGIPMNGTVDILAFDFHPLP